MSYDLLIEKNHTVDDLRSLVAEFLKVDIRNIGDLYDRKTDNEVNIRLSVARGDFKTRFEVYKSLDMRHEVKEVDFAMFLSTRLNNFVLMTYWDSNPYLWILVQPNGSLYKVMDIPNEDEYEKEESPFLEINPSYREE
jgi:hypothetical protein